MKFSYRYHPTSLLVCEKFLFISKFHDSEVSNWYSNEKIIFNSTFSYGVCGHLGYQIKKSMCRGMLTFCKGMKSYCTGAVKISRAYLVTKFALRLYVNGFLSEV